MLELWNFLVSNRHELLLQTGEHVALTLIALTVAVLVGIPLSLYLTRNRTIADPVLGVVGVVQTIPSIALLGFLLPLLGIGALPAIVALFLYALLPIVRNTFAGIEEVDSSVVEAARGMGMTDGQLLMKVELPLAAPVIFAGIRTATVINVGVATLCALIGAGGLGEFIFRGIALNNVNMILAGAFPAAGLALFFDYSLGLVERHIGRLIKPLGYAFVILLLLIVPWSLSSWLGGSEFRLAAPHEFLERRDGYRGLVQHYDINMPTVEMNAALMYEALHNGRVDVIVGYSTDGRIKAFDLKVLEDDRNYFPPYEAAPLVNGMLLTRYPELREVLNSLAGRISTSAMTELNSLVDFQQQDERLVARNFLDSLGFKTSVHREGEPDLLIGGKLQTEQYLLGHMYEMLIENQTRLDAGLRLGLAGTQIVFEALRNGEIGIYPEYTGTGLHVLLDAVPDRVDSLGNDSIRIYEFVSRRMTERYGLQWLKPLGFENSYALIMRRAQAERLGIETISDLSAFLNRNGNLLKTGSIRP